MAEELSARGWLSKVVMGILSQLGYVKSIQLLLSQPQIALKQAAPPSPVGFFLA